MDALSDFMLVVVSDGGSQYGGSILESNVHSVAAVSGWGLPGAETDGWDLVPCVERVNFVGGREVSWMSTWGKGGTLYEVTLLAAMIAGLVPTCFVMRTVGEGDA